MNKLLICLVSLGATTFIGCKNDPIAFGATGARRVYNSSEGWGNGYELLAFTTGYFPVYMRLTATRYEDISTYRFGVGGSMAKHLRSGVTGYTTAGLAMHINDNLDLGLGAPASAGLLFRSKRLNGLGLAIEASVYAWVGERKNKFDIGAESSASAHLVWSF